jgi:excisionase family DNA binding protein
VKRKGRDNSKGHLGGAEQGGAARHSQLPEPQTGLDPQAPSSAVSADEGYQPLALTVSEAARILRVNPKTLYQAIKLGQVPGVIHVGRTIRVSRAALLGWPGGNGRPDRGSS